MKMLGDLNDKVGTDNTNIEHIMGIHSTGEQNENGELFTEFCSFNDLIKQIQGIEEKRILPARYWEKNREVKKSTRKDTKKLLRGADNRGRGCRRSKKYGETLRDHQYSLEEEQTPQLPRQRQEWYMIPGQEEQRTRWVEHFMETLNRQALPDFPPPTELLDNTNPPNRAEIAKAIKSLKSGKAAGPDCIRPDIQTSTDILHPLL
ncbi:hypothetical protein EGW08_021130 [Elysia chlorotica]|uniref:Reverse transcriptase domain-containing protein n=1 Tax=Elysia chlorotica TaxID=188477 RepID=A0A433SPG8_ELYCH|nr:hypothetical protein EGW08_021130 [Elysia chlorotica]